MNILLNQIVFKQKTNMKKLKEKLKAIYHIIMDDEYAVYTVTIKNGKRVKGKTCCLISDNASKIFLETIVEFTKKIHEKIN